MNHREARAELRGAVYRLPFLLQGCRATGSARGRPCSHWRPPKPVPH
jgi:hypothetical protein